MNAWQCKSADLAALTFRLLVNNPLRWLAYMELAKRGLVMADGRKLPDKTYAAPTEAMIGKLKLTTGRLQVHFAARSETDIIGLYAISPANTSRWCMWDFDNHDGSGQCNREAAIFYYDKLVSLGFNPILIESDDRDGFHLWLIFNKPIASEAAHYIGRWLTSDYQDHRLTERPESFPKQPKLTPAVKYGNAARVWGRHHTRDYWPKVFDGFSWVEQYEAVAILLDASGGDPSLIPSDAAPPAPQPTEARAHRIFHTSPDQRIERCLKYVARMNPSISGSRGHDRLLPVATKTWEFGLQKSDAMIVLREFNLRCQPAWTEAELEYKYGQAEKLNGPSDFGKLLRVTPDRTYPITSYRL